MRNDHIIKMLEEKSVSNLSEGEIDYVESHAADCSRCLQAYEAARICAALVEARASEIVDPSPFFKTRVMAALKEKELSPELPALVRMWKAAGALVSMLAALVVVLVGLSFFSSDTQGGVPEPATGQNIYLPEYAVFEQSELADEALPYDQVLATMYESGDADGQ